MLEANKKIKQIKTSTKNQPSLKKGLQKKKNLSFENFIQELQQELDSFDDENLFEDSSDEDFNNFIELVEFLSPKEISMLFNSFGGNFSQSEGKAIKKFVLFISSFNDLEDEEEDEIFDKLANSNHYRSKKKNEKVLLNDKSVKDKELLKKKPGKQSKPSKVNKEEIYIILTRFGSVTRTIGISSEQTLDDLHLAIQQYYDRDNDHFYAFYLNKSRFFLLKFHHFYCCPYHLPIYSYTRIIMSSHL
jgi:hypothetical protein